MTVMVRKPQTPITTTLKMKSEVLFIVRGNVPTGFLGLVFWLRSKTTPVLKGSDFQRRKRWV